MKKALSFLCIILLAAGVIAAPVYALTQRQEIRNESRLQFLGPRQNDLTASIETSLGTVEVILYESLAPLAVANFTTLAQSGYYNGSAFHRVVQNFIIQAGAPGTTGTGGESSWGAPFRTEIREGLRHYSGALCMANSGGVADTNNSQFYFVATPQGNITEQAIADMRTAGIDEYIIDMYNIAGGAPYLDNTDTVFGQVYMGMEVVDAIAAVATDANARPIEDITILSVTIGRYTEPETTEENTSDPAAEEVENTSNEASPESSTAE